MDKPYKISFTCNSVKIEEEKILIKKILTDKKIKEHVVTNLASSLHSIGYSGWCNR